MKFFNMEIINMIIGLLALVISIVSILYTWWFNRYKIAITNINTEKIDLNIKVSFVIVNFSSREIKIEDVKLFKNDKMIKDNGFDPVDFEEFERKYKRDEWNKEYQAEYGFSIGMNPYNMPNMPRYGQQSSPFNDPFYLKGNDSFSLSFFVDDIPDKIELETDHFIGFFSHSYTEKVNFHLN